MEKPERHDWIAYDTHAETDDRILAVFAKKGIDPTLNLRRCPVAGCGAREYIDRGRLMVSQCDVDSHAKAEGKQGFVPDLVVPRRAGEEGYIDDTLSLFHR